MTAARAEERRSGRGRRRAGRVLRAAAGAAIAAGLAAAAPRARAAEAAPPDRVDEAVRRAVGFLVSQQRPDGAIRDREHATAMTALAVMSLCSVGHLPADETPEGAAIRKGLDYLLAPARQEDNGYYGGRDGSRMYGHGIVTLMLSEVLGMGVDDPYDRRIRERLQKALDLILRGQKKKKTNDARQYGGWRYEPDAHDSDLSLTIWQLLALRSAKNDGMDLPKTAIDAAVRYVKECFREDGGRARRTKKGRPGACAYQPERGPSYASAAAGLLALQVCGEYEADEVASSADWLIEEKLDYDNGFFFYGTYYYAQGMYQRGGDYAEQARKNVEALLLARQEKDGSWQARGGQEKEAGRVYATSMALLSLSVKYHYLPIYQR